MNPALPKPMYLSLSMTTTANHAAITVRYRTGGSGETNRRGAIDDLPILVADDGYPIPPSGAPHPLYTPLTDYSQPRRVTQATEDVGR
jgi:hypothetical protein